MPYTRLNDRELMGLLAETAIAAVAATPRVAMVNPEWQRGGISESVYTYARAAARVALRLLAPVTR